MRRSRTIGTGMRTLACALALASIALPPAAAQDGESPEATPLVGAWTGEYECNQGITGLTLTITRARPDDVRAIFHFYASPRNPGIPTGCFEMSGTVEQETGRVQLEGGRWLLRPPTYRVVDFFGQMAGSRFRGRVAGFNCTTFRLARLPHPRPVPPECRPGSDPIAARDAPTNRDPG